MEKLLKLFEKVIVLALLGMMMVAILVSTIELAVVLFQELSKPPLLLLNITEMLEVFGFFLMVLIGLELLETIKAYLHDDRVHAEVVFLVALVAVSLGDLNAVGRWVTIFFLTLYVTINASAALERLVAAAFTDGMLPEAYDPEGSGFDEALQVHESLGIPGNFHLSGTLMTAADWAHNEGDPQDFNGWLASGVTGGS